MRSALDPVQPDVLVPSVVEGVPVSIKKLGQPDCNNGFYLLGALCLLLPMILGGCPDFQDEVVNAVDTAVSGLLNAALNLYFDQFRSNGGF